MTGIETERLALIPLTAPQLRLLIRDIPGLEKALDCLYRAEPIKGRFRKIVRKQLRKTKKDPENYLWHSFWLLVRRADRTVVGSADFKDVPSGAGEVEIGYGLGREFEHNGYMTEAVKAMCAWALSREDVTAVLAETELTGFASQRILQRCGFAEQRRGETIWWRLSAVDARA